MCERDGTIFIFYQWTWPRSLTSYSPVKIIVGIIYLWSAVHYLECSFSYPVFLFRDCHSMWNPKARTVLIDDEHFQMCTFVYWIGHMFPVLVVCADALISKNRSRSSQPTDGKAAFWSSAAGKVLLSFDGRENLSANRHANLIHAFA